MVLNMKENGKKINNMVGGLRHGLMGLVMKVIIKKGKKMDLGFLSGLMEVFMKENLLII